MADWSSLPHELLELIALRLESLEDFVAFSAICRPWNYIYKLLKGNGRLPKAMPWLMLSFIPNLHQDFDLFDPCKDKCYHLNLPEVYRQRCWGTSLGWILIWGPNLKIHLFNPLTRALLMLPPRPILAGERSFLDTDKYIGHLHYIRRTFVLKLPDDGQLIVFMVSFVEDRLSFIRPGDSSWTPVQFRKALCQELFELPNVMDITYWDGAILIISRYGEFTFLDLNQIGQGSCIVENYRCGPPELANLYPSFHSGRRMAYLVECFGNLLMVIRFKGVVEDYDEDNPDDLLTTNFKVYQHNPLFDIDQGWEELHDLGGISIFVGSQTTMCILASDVVNCSGNSIYFTDDHYPVWKSRDMGFFNMESRVIKKYYLDDDDTRFNLCSPIWFFPNI